MPRAESNSQFDPEVEVKFVEEDESGFSKRRKVIRVKGKLGEELEEYAPYLRVLVSVWQTEEDIKDDGLPQVLVAHALGVGKRDWPGRWSAELTLMDGQLFEPGSATGLAHAVGNNGDPGGFETYTWTRRLHIENP